MYSDEYDHAGAEVCRRSERGLIAKLMKNLNTVQMIADTNTCGCSKATIYLALSSVMGMQSLTQKRPGKFKWQHGVWNMPGKRLLAILDGAKRE